MATINTAIKLRYSFKSRRVFANIAQLEERAVEARKVLGSIPSVGTKEPKKFGYRLLNERSQVRILLVIERLL